MAYKGIKVMDDKNVQLNADEASNYGLAAGIYTPEQLNNAGNSYSTFLGLSPEEQSMVGASGATFKNGVMSGINTNANTGLFGIGTDKQWAQYGGLGVDLLNTGLAFAGFNEAKKNNSAKRALLNQQIESNRYAMQNKKNIQNSFTA